MLIDVDYDNNGNQGLCNKLIYLSGLIRYCIKNNYKLLEPKFKTGFKHGTLGDGIKFSDIWDINHFNKCFDKFNFNLVIREINTENVNKLGHEYANILGWSIEHNEYINVACKFNKISKNDNILLLVLSSLKLNNKNKQIKDKIQNKLGNIYNCIHLRIENDWKTHMNHLYIHENNVINSLKKFYDNNSIEDRLFVSSAENYNVIENIFKHSKINIELFKDSLQFYDLKSAISFELCKESNIFIGLSASTFSSLITMVRELFHENNNNYYYTNTSIKKRNDKGIHYLKPHVNYNIDVVSTNVEIIDDLSMIKKYEYFYNKYNRLPAHKLALVAIFKNERHILEEWILHYIKQGVDKFYLINNGSNDNYLDILEKYKNDKILDLVNDSKRYSQVELYNKYFLEKRNKCEWLMICDLDEFIYARNGYSRIIDYLDSLDKNIGQIKIPWKMFGSSGYINQPDYVVKSFLKRQSYNIKQKINCKSIVRGTHCLRLDIHQHHSSGSVINCDNTPDLNPFNFTTVSENKLNNCFLHCNHYAIQSKNWFLNIKKTRGDATSPATDNIRNLNYFNEYDHNEYEDLELSKCNKLSK